LPIVFNPYNVSQSSSREYRGFGGAFGAILEEHDRRAQEARWSKNEYLIGLDLGQTNDYTAVSILQPVGSKLRLRHLDRLPLGMSYPNQVRAIQALYNKLEGRRTLIIDRTGIGRAIYDMFREGGLNPVGVTFTSGEKTIRLMQKTPTGLKPRPEFRTPKLEIVSALNLVMQQGHLQIARGLKYGDVLTNELKDFEMQVRPTGHVSFNAKEGSHDDVLISVGLVAWWWLNRSRYMKVPTRPMVYGAVGAGGG
jgi:hypothetical protein